MRRPSQLRRGAVRALDKRSEAAHPARVSDLSIPESHDPHRREGRWGSGTGYLVSFALVALVTLIGGVLFARGNSTDIGLLYLIPVMYAGTRHGLAGHDHGVDVVGPQDGLDRRLGACVERPGHLGRGAGTRIGDGHEGSPVDASGDDGSVGGADAAGADQADANGSGHGSSECGVRWAGRGRRGLRVRTTGRGLD